MMLSVCSHRRPINRCVAISVLLGPCICIAKEGGPAIIEAPSMDTIPGQSPPKDPMTELLHWGLEHSEPERLKELMLKYKEKNLTITDVYGKDVLDAMFTDEGKVMRDLVSEITDFRNMSVSDEDLENAITRLQELVEQVDNAGNLHRMGGLAPLLDCAVGHERSVETRTLAMWTLGVAIQNNEPVQADLASIDGVRRLGLRLGSCGRPAALAEGEWNTVVEDAQYCGKLLYALSGLIKNNADSQRAAHALGVFDWLLVAGIRHQSVAVMKKSVSLFETVLAQTPDMPLLDSVHAQQEPFAASLLELIRGTGNSDADIDKAEKALHLINRILALRPTLFRLTFKSDLDEAVRIAVLRCEAFRGAGDESCVDVRDLGVQADMMLAAIDVSDDEL